MGTDRKAPRLSELIDNCRQRGPVFDIDLRWFMSDKKIGLMDRFDAEEQYGERLVIKHRRNKTRITAWIY